MTTSSFCCNPSDRLDRVAKLVLDHDCGAIPVCEARKLVGMITDRDITCRAVATGKAPASVPVSEIMTTRVYAIRQDENVEAAIDLMKTKLIRRLPVLNDAGEVVGIVAPSDLAPTLASNNVAEHKVEDSGPPLSHRHGLIETTSLVFHPRTSASCFSSRENAKCSNVWPESKCVIGVAAVSSSGRRQILEIPSGTRICATVTPT